MCQCELESPGCDLCAQTWAVLRHRTLPKSPCGGGQDVCPGEHSAGNTGLRWLGKCALAGTSLGCRASPNIPRGQGLLLGEGEALTFLLHSCSEALLQPAVPALVPLIFVYHTLPVKPAKEGRKV